MTGALTARLAAAARISAPHDVIVMLEADNTNWLRGTLSAMLDKLSKGSDVVCCSRYQKGGYYENFPLVRLIFSVGANYLMRLIFRIKDVKDYTIFFRGYSAQCVKRALEVYGSSLIERKGFVANAEILVKLARIGARITEVPLRYFYGKKKSKSKLRIRKTTLEYFRFILDLAIQNPKICRELPETNESLPTVKKSSC